MYFIGSGTKLIDLGKQFKSQDYDEEHHSVQNKDVHWRMVQTQHVMHFLILCMHCLARFQLKHNRDVKQ